MSLGKSFSFFKKHKVFFTLGSSFAVLAISISLVNFARVVYASYASWGNTSLVHGCLNDRGGIAIVDSTDTCKVNETEITFLKDVDAGSGITITRDSGGATISLASTSEDGWVDAGETWTYASADDPTFTFTVSGDVTTKYSPGMRVKLAQTTDKYFLITAVSYSSPNTTVTVYGGTDYDLANATITDPYFSTQKAPYGFPLDPAKWTVETTYSTNGNQGSPSVSTWYNIGSVSIDVPIGIWDLSYNTVYGFDKATEGGYNAYVTLSTSSSSESDSDYTSGHSANAIKVNSINAYRNKAVNLSSETTYYLLVKTESSSLNFIYMGSSANPTIIRAVSSYL